MMRMERNGKSRIGRAIGWSTAGELCVKMAAPLSALLLARLLTPEDFGMMVSVTLLTGLGEMLQDCGMQKYIIQHRFRSMADMRLLLDTSFWSGLAISIFIWLGITLFSIETADILGTPDIAPWLWIAALIFPLSALSSVHTAVLKRNMNYRRFFFVRIAGGLIPVLVTVPLAFLFHHWTALLFGTLASYLAIFLTSIRCSGWHPRLRFSFRSLKEMLPFSIWSEGEGLLVWLTLYADLFIVGKMLDSHHLGLYRAASLSVGQITGLITMATTPVLYAALSQVQRDKDKFRERLLSFQKNVAYILVPLCTGLFLFSGLTTSLLLGEQWMDISPYIGLWGITSMTTILISSYASEIYRASGCPQRALLAQGLHLVAVVPVVIWGIALDFETLCSARAWVRLEGVAVNLVMLHMLYRFSPAMFLRNMAIPLLGGFSMCAVMFLPTPQSLLAEAGYLLIALALYLAVIFSFNGRFFKIKIDVSV